MKKLVIQRRKWARIKQDRSAPAGRSLLLNMKGGMCCLGFDCMMHGATSAALLGRYSPIEAAIDREALPCSLNFAQQRHAMTINDRAGSLWLKPGTTDSQQEDMLISLWKDAGVELSFED